jgi:hypothetical protein
MILDKIALIILLHGLTNPRSTEAFSIKRLSEGGAMVVAGLLGPSDTPQARRVSYNFTSS